MTKKPKFLAGACGVVFLLICNLSAFCQRGNLRFSRFTIDNGLSENLVYTITQDHEGFMWFGTQDGLDRFDGYGFTVFHHNPFDTASLSDNIIITLFSDSKGRLWIGTAHGGLNLYDPVHHNFIHFLTYHKDANHVSGDYIESITEDKKGNLWIGTFGNGIFEFVFSGNHPGNRPAKIVHYVHQPGNSASPASNYVLCVFADAEQRLWVDYLNSPLQRVLLNKKHIRFVTPRFTVISANQDYSKGKLAFDLKHPEWVKKTLINSGPFTAIENHHQLWMGMGDGLYLLKANSDTLMRFNFSQPTAIQGTILSICKAPGETGGLHSLWLGGYYGLVIFNTQKLTARLVRNDPLNKESLLGGRILKVYKDRSGCIWLGTNGTGLSKYDFHTELFSTRQYFDADSKAQTGPKSILSFLDTRKYLLIGSFSGLWKIDKENHLPHHVTKGSMWPQLVQDIIPADSSGVWLAGSKGLTYYNPQNDQSVLYIPHISFNRQEDNAIINIYDDHHGCLWVLTSNSLSVFNIAKKTFTNYYYNYKTANDANELPNGNIYRDHRGNFWLGSNQGLVYFDSAQKTFHHFTNNPKDSFSISYNDVGCIIPDPKYPDKYLWIGTVGGGLNKFNLKTKKFKHFTIQNGLPDNLIHGILADGRGNLWMSTNKGITKFNPVTEVFHNYDVHQGLPSDEFNPGAYYKNKRGKLFFGSINGFVTFYPDSIKANTYSPPVMFTDFRLFNKSVSEHDKHSPLKQSITETKLITLPYKDNIISFQVAALNYSNTDQDQYAYRLKNFNKRWISNGSNRLITFGNLNPGHYTLQVKAANSDGVWSTKTAFLDLNILPPWWKTWWAYLIYAVLAVILIWLLRSEELRRLKLENSLKLEHLEAAKFKEIDHLKSRFFANISHEFRTPLTLLMGPLDDLQRDDDVESFKNLLPEMRRNSKRLLQLINQLLDLSKLDANSYRINTSREDIIPFVRQILHSFASMAERRNIRLETDVDPVLRNTLSGETATFYFDDEIVEKILTNLLSNAFKFTQDGGEVIVRMGLHQNLKDYLELKMEDNGMGIPAEKLPFIFDRFYQTDRSMKRQHEGSGIGLSLVKELIELHQGRISVSSQPNKGTIFTCLFPFNQKIVTDQGEGKENKATRLEIPLLEAEKDIAENDLSQQADGKPLILVVEDHRDVRKYIVEKLEHHYQVSEAGDGKEGLNLAFEHIPDLVISDVMMPRMDGFELCRHLKTDDRTSHIPVILLTARAEDVDKISGLETGADAYLIKPFNSEELRVRVRNLIRVRNKMRVKFSDKLVVKPSEVAVTSIDQQFMQKLLSVVEDHISDPQFSVDQLADHMNMSASQIYRKLKALINQSAQQFIRSVRMQRALQLLKNDSGTVSEVSSKVGFEDPGYFSKVFKNHFDCLPSEKDRLPG